MLIKSEKEKSLAGYLYKAFKSRLFKSRLSKVILFFLILFTYTGAVIFFTKPSIKNKFIGSIPEDLRDKAKAIANPVYGFNWIKALLTQSDDIFLDLKFEDLEKLEKKRSEAIKIKTLITSPDDFVNAVIGNKSKSVKAKIRLKGDSIDHLYHKKWSYRVKVRGGETLFGMNKFSLQRPGTRNHMWEWIYHKMLNYEGLPSLKYFFANLKLNGNNLGIYAVEQHFDKILLESNLFKEGPILKFSESNLWANRAEYHKYNFVDPNENDYFYRTKPDVFKKKKILENPELKKHLIKAEQLLNGFYLGELKTSEVFDVEFLAKFFAITDLTNAFHGAIWHNQRFYYDPVISKLIPIGFDALPNTNLENINIDNQLSINNERIELPFFEDLIFLKSYIKQLEKVSQRIYLDNLLENVDQELKNNTKILHKSYPATVFNSNILYEKQKAINIALNPNEPINSYLQNIKDDYIELKLGNNQFFPIEIVSVLLNGEKITDMDKGIILKGKKKNDLISYKTFQFKTKPDLKINKELFDLKISYKLYGSDIINSSTIIPYKSLSFRDAKLDFARREVNFENFDFIEYDETNKIINFKKGNWILNQPLIIPEEHKVFAGSGFNITLQNEGLIFSKSAINFEGSKDENIKIKSVSNGQGLIVVNAENKSKLKFVNFDNLSNPKSEYWSVPGAVTFYQSPVYIDNCMFENNISEDSLNIVRTNFTLSNSSFINSKSDAIDIDFANGEINNIKINNSANDGLDISGSKIKAYELNIKSSGDKAISAGEGSQLNIENALITDSLISIASKDNSLVEGDNIISKSNKIGFTSFQKKKEYGPGYINLSNLLVKDVEKLYLLPEQSRIILNDKDLPANSTNKYLNNLLYLK